MKSAKADEAKSTPFPMKDVACWKEISAQYGGDEGLSTKRFIAWVKLMETEILKTGKMSYEIIEKTYIKIFPGRTLGEFYATVGMISGVWKRGDELIKCVEDHDREVKAKYEKIYSEAMQMNKKG